MLLGVTKQVGFREPWRETKERVSTLLLHRGPSLELLLRAGRDDRDRAKAAKREPSYALPHARDVYNLCKLALQLWEAIASLEAAARNMHNALLHFEEEYGDKPDAGKSV